MEELHLQCKNGYKNYSELSSDDIDKIVKVYFENNLSIKEIEEKFKLTKRTMPKIFKTRNINSRIKNRYTLNESYFKDVDNERKAYWLGYLYADGFIGDEKHNNIVFSQKESDGYIVEEFAKDINFTGKLRRVFPGKGSYKNSKTQIVINFSSPLMVKDLYSLNMFNNKSINRTRLPPINPDLLRHFVRGYSDGDGCIYETVRGHYKNNIYKSFCWNITGNETFVNKIAELLPITTKLYDSCTSNIKYIKTTSNKSIIPLYNYLYQDATIFLKRKRDIFQRAIGYVNRKLLNR